MLHRVSFVLIIVLALSLRLFNLGKHGLYTDEKFTLLNIHGICVGGYNQQELYKQATFTPQDYWKERNLEDYYQAVARADFGTHITHNTFLHYWSKVFGKSDFALRLMSVLFSMLLIVVVYWFCKKLLDNTSVGLWAMLLVALDPLLISQAHYARSYNLSFLLLLLASYVFLKLLKSDRKNNTLIVLYAVLASLSLLNHYLNFVILLVHVILAVLYLRNTKKWVYLLGAGAFTLAVMAYWMILGGGQWSLRFLEDKNALHAALAKLPTAENPMRGIVEPSNLQNVSKMASEIFLDANVFSFDFLRSFNGIRNLGIFITFGVLSSAILIAFKKHYKIILALIAALALVSGIWFFDGLEKTLILRSLLIFAVVYGIVTSSIEKKYLIFLFLASTLPFFYVLFDAFKTGHTTSISHRYIGNSVPFIAILMAVGFDNLLKKSKPYRTLILILFVLQLYPLFKELNVIYADESARYSFRTTARVKNPYWEIAQKVKANYSPGDTLLLPSYDGSVYSGHSSKSENPISILDAQYLNVYFEPSDEFVQKIDAREPNKVILLKENGSVMELFDFENSKYRY